MNTTMECGPSALAQEPSRLLRLPCELRDMIYLYTLSYAGGLGVELRCATTNGSRVCMRSYGLQNHHRTRTPMNTLKLVCKQLREETRALLFKANSDIAFYGMSYSIPNSYAFGLFVSQLSVAARHCLRRITIHGCPGLYSSSLTPVSIKELVRYAAGFRPFCEQCPQTIVILQFRKVVGVYKHTWFYWAGALQQFLRGVSPLVTPGRRPQFASMLLKISRAFANTAKLPDNLRLAILELWPKYPVELQIRIPGPRSEVLKGAVRKLLDDGI